jgi:hypothetical protein
VLTSAAIRIGLSSIAGWNSVALVTVISNLATLPVLAVTTAAVIIVPALQEEIIKLDIPGEEQVKLLNPYGMSPY